MAAVAQDQTLLASAARTATGQGTAVTGLYQFTTATVMLDITVDESTSADTLSVLIQRLMPDQTAWDSIARFTTALGDAGASQQVIDLVSTASAGGARAVDSSTTSPTITSGAIRDVSWTDQWRVIWIIVDDSGSASFTFSVRATFRI
jgi:hypothetical protein